MERILGRKDKASLQTVVALSFQDAEADMRTDLFLKHVLRPSPLKDH